MNRLFEHLSANWFHYMDYEWRTAADGHEYLMPAPDAQGKPYDPLKRADQLLLEALEIGMQILHRASKEKLKEVIRAFACRYGLLGLITALPTTSQFINYKQVYLPKNQFIREEVMDTQDYTDLFFPFEPLSVNIYPNGSSINVSDRNSMAIMLTYMNQPEGMVVSFFRNYGERYDWMVTVFRDWAFTLVSAFLYYKDKDLGSNPYSLELYRLGMAAFGGNAPTYHIELRDKPTIVWDFHSLMMGIKMVHSFRLTDAQHPLRLCDQCQKVFIAKRADSKFCSSECRKRWTASHGNES